MLEALNDDDGDDAFYIHKGGCDRDDYGRVFKRLFSQSSSQIKFQYLPSTSRDSFLKWIEYNPDCVQVSDRSFSGEWS